MRETLTFNVGNQMEHLLGLLVLVALVLLPLLMAYIGASIFNPNFLEEPELQALFELDPDTVPEELEDVA